MKKYILTFLFFIGNFYFSQNIIKIIDNETQKPVPNAELIAENSVYFTNDDGEVLVPENVKNFTVQSAMYQPQNIMNKGNQAIALLPVVKEIEEIKINPYPIKKIFEETLKNYKEIYYTEPSLYDCTIRDKAYSGGKLNNLLIANLKIWTTNFYNSKEKTDKFLQISFNEIKYFKSEKEAVFIIPDRFKSLIFLNSRLQSLLYSQNTKDLNWSSKYSKLNENQILIEFESDYVENKGMFKGLAVYNKTDKAISYLRVETITEQNSEQEQEYTTVNSFVKRDGKYIPSAVNINGSGFRVKENSTEKNPFSAEQVIYFSTFAKGKNGGLKNKIDLSVPLIKNIPDNEINTSDILLSQEEKAFVEGK